MSLEERKTLKNEIQEAHAEMSEASAVIRELRSELRATRNEASEASPDAAPRPEESLESAEAPGPERYALAATEATELREAILRLTARSSPPSDANNWNITKRNINSSFLLF